MTKYNRLRFFKEKDVAKQQEEKYISFSVDSEGLVTMHTWVVMRPSPDEQIFEEVVEKKLKR